MQIYFQNRGIYGISVVVANSESEAKILIDREVDYVCIKK